MIVKSVTGGSSDSGLLQYMSESGSERELEPGVRDLFTTDGDAIDVERANELLGRGTEIEQGELIHLVVSLRPEEFEALGDSEEERREGLRELALETVSELGRELGVEELVLAGAIHRNTANPHVHLAVSRLARSPDSQVVRIEHLPRELWSGRAGEAAQSFRDRVYDALERRSHPREGPQRELPVPVAERQVAPVAGGANVPAATPRALFWWERQQQGTGFIDRLRAARASEREREAARIAATAAAASTDDVARALGDRLVARLRVTHASWQLERISGHRDVLRYEVSELRRGADGQVRAVDRTVSINDIAKRSEARAQGAAASSSFANSADRDAFLADAYHRDLDKNMSTVAQIEARHEAHVKELEKRFRTENSALEALLATTAWVELADTAAVRPQVESRLLDRLEQQAISRHDAGGFAYLDSLRQEARTREAAGLLSGASRVAESAATAAESRLGDFDRDRHSRRVEVGGRQVSLAVLDRERLRVERSISALDRGLVHLAVSGSRLAGLASRLVEPIGRSDESSPVSELRRLDLELARNGQERERVEGLLDQKRAELSADAEARRELADALAGAIEREAVLAHGLAAEHLSPFDAFRLEADAILRRDPELLRSVACQVDTHDGNTLTAARRAEGRALAAEVAMMAAADRLERFTFFDQLVPVRIRESDGSESLARGRDDAPRALRLAPTDRNRPPTGSTMRDVVTGRVSVEISLSALLRRVASSAADRERIARVDAAIEAEHSRLSRDFDEATAFAAAARSIADARLDEAVRIGIGPQSVREAPIFGVDQAAIMERSLAGASGERAERLSSLLESAIDDGRVKSPKLYTAAEGRAAQSSDEARNRRNEPKPLPSPDIDKGEVAREPAILPAPDKAREGNAPRPVAVERDTNQEDKQLSVAARRTHGQMRAQIQALGGTVTIGILDGRGRMLERTLTLDTAERSVGYLRHSNARGSHIYVRPADSNGVVLMDDLPRSTVDQLRRDGLAPAAVVETSPGNHQAWIRLSDKPVPREVATAAARDLARAYGTDERGAAWNHYGRLAGFTNPKPKYASERGFPFSQLRATSGAVAPRGADILERATANLEKARTQAQVRVEGSVHHLPEGRNLSADLDPKMSYERIAARAPADVAADRSRLDWRVAMILAREGRDRSWISSALESAMDGRTKSPDYIERTVSKAIDAIAASREQAREYSREREGPRGR